MSGARRKFTSIPLVALITIIGFSGIVVVAILARRKPATQPAPASPDVSALRSRAIAVSRARSAEHTGIGSQRVPEWFWKAVIIVVGLAIIVALFVLGVNIAVEVGRAAVGFGFGVLFPSPRPQ